MYIHEDVVKRYNVENEYLLGLKVEVYRNLHSGKWSVKALEGVYKGKVILHTPELILDESIFVVSDKGREWVRENKVKKVHAVVRGKLISLKLCENYKENISKDEIYYNPYVNEKFILRYNGEELGEEFIKVKFTENCKVYKLN